MLSRAVRASRSRTVPRAPPVAIAAIGARQIPIVGHGWRRWWEPGDPGRQPQPREIDIEAKGLGSIRYGFILSSANV